MNRRVTALDRSLHGLGLGDVARNGFHVSGDAECGERRPHALG
jgi:hypothetical protein